MGAAVCAGEGSCSQGRRGTFERLPFLLRILVMPISQNKNQPEREFLETEKIHKLQTLFFFAGQILKFELDSRYIEISSDIMDCSTTPQDTTREASRAHPLVSVLQQSMIK